MDDFSHSFYDSVVHFRVLKTVVASFLALVISHQIGVQYPLFPALAACFCIRQTFIGSLNTFFNEIKMTGYATLLALVAGGFFELSHHYGYDSFFIEYLLTSLALGGVIVVVIYFEWYNTVFIGLLTVLYIVLLPRGEASDELFLASGVIRFGTILLGSSLALVVDYLFSGFEYNRLFYQRTHQTLKNIESMLEQFAEAVTFKSRDRANRILNQAVDALNLLDYFSDKLEKLDREMNFRGEHIHNFSRQQVDTLRELVRHLRLICYQLEGTGVNFLRLLNLTESQEEMLSDDEYEKLSVQVRHLADKLTYLNRALQNESPEPLNNIPELEELDVNYEDYFDESLQISDVQLLVYDTIASIHRIEFHLEKVARILRKYYSLHNDENNSSNPDYSM